MKKCIIIIGPSCAGKTTYIRKNFLSNNLKFIDEPFKITISDEKTLLFGHHKGEKRCEGTDELSMSILPKLMDFIRQNKDKYDIVIAEGDRINNEKFFKFIQSLDILTDLYVITCSVEESVKRRVQTGSKPSETFVKTTKTKALKMRTLGRQLGFNVIDIDTNTKKEPSLMDFIGS